MNSGLSFVFTFFLMSAYGISFAQTPSRNCVPVNPISGNMQAQVLETSKGCEVMLSPVNQTPTLRRYTFSERGVIQIFNQYSDNTNGSRSFFVFPHSQIPTLTVVSNQEMEVVTSAGDKIKFDTSANPPKIKNDSNASFQMIENPVVAKTNQGGVEVYRTSASRTLILDSGFEMGGAAFTSPDKSSTFYDINGNHCTFVNSKLFNFANDDADLKYTDAGLFAFLKTACPTLQLPAL
jgi:hypothetical protein